MNYYVPSTPPPRGRAYSLSQGARYPYPPTPYSGVNSLSVPYYDTPGVTRSATYYVPPTVVSGRSRSHSRPRGRSHHRSHHHGHHRSHSRRPHSVGAHRQHYPRPTSNRHSYRTAGTTSRYPYHSPSLGTRILNFFGLGSSHRYVDQHGRSVDSRGRPKYKL